MQSKTIVAYVVLLFTPHALLGYNTSSSEKLLGYANSLVEQRDYYRGISVLKYVAYFTEDQQTKACVSLQNR